MRKVRQVPGLGLIRDAGSVRLATWILGLIVGGVVTAVALQAVIGPGGDAEPNAATTPTTVAAEVPAAVASPEVTATEPLSASTATPAPTSEPTAAIPTEVTPIVHVVVPGDSLAALAEANGVSLAALLDANGLALSDTIFVGQELIIPTSDAN